MSQETIGSRSCSASHSNWPSWYERSPFWYSGEDTGAVWNELKYSSTLQP